MSSPYRIVSCATFRAKMAEHLRFVRSESGRLWLTYYGRCTAAVIPEAQLWTLEEIEVDMGRPFERRKLEEEYRLRRGHPLHGRPKPFGAPDRVQAKMLE